MFTGSEPFLAGPVANPILLLDTLLIDMLMGLLLLSGERPSNIYIMARRSFSELNRPWLNGSSTSSLAMFALNSLRKFALASISLI